MSTLGFVGTGAITEAMVRGLAQSPLGRWPVIVSPRSAERAARLASEFPAIAVAAANQDVVDRSDIVVLAIRPQVAAEVIAALTFRPGQTVISLVAGLTLGALEGLIAAPVALVRAIPLPSVQRRACVTPIMPPDANAARIFDALGQTLAVSDAAAFDAYVAGSAVMASYFGMIDAAAAWMERNGLPRGAAETYLRNLYANLGDTMRERAEASLDDLRSDHATRGGLNEMVHDRFVGGGGVSALTDGLDAVLRRVRAG